MSITVEKRKEERKKAIKERKKGKKKKKKDVGILYLCTYSLYAVILESSVRTFV